MASRVVVSGDGREVQWVQAGRCVRRFVYAERVVDAGFVTFEKVNHCFVVVRRRAAHVYYLDSGDSVTACFPFPIRKAFWYRHGLVLEAADRGDADADAGVGVDGDADTDVGGEYRFITFTDPVAPFGRLSFASAGGKGKLAAHLRDSEMLLIPRDASHSVTVLYNKCENQLYFYFTRVLSSSSSQVSSAGAGAGTNAGTTVNNHTETNNATLRRALSNSRRTTSTNGTLDMMLGNIEKMDPSINNKRSVSATLDRMSNSNPASASLEFGQHQMQPEQPQLQAHQPILAKDISLIEISRMELPAYTHKQDIDLKCIALRFKQQEAVLIFDQSTKFAKLWLIDMIPDVVESISFKVYGDSPPNLIKLANIDVANPIDTVLEQPEADVQGTFILKFQDARTDSFAIYNPFLNLLSPMFISERATQQVSETEDTFPQDSIQLQLEKITFYPRTQLTKLCFQALSWICPDYIHYSLLMLWQYTLNSFQEPVATLTNQNDILKEFHTLTYILRNLFFSIANEDVPDDICNMPLYQGLLDKGITEINLLLPKIVMGLQLIREELSLNILCRKELELLNEFLLGAVHTMDWPQSWKTYYQNNAFEAKDGGMTSATVGGNFFAQPLDEPPSILKSLYSITEGSEIALTPFIGFSGLVDCQEDIDLMITPRCFKVLRLYELIHAPGFVSMYILEILTRLDIGNKEINTYPLGIMTPVRKILQKVENGILQPDIHMNLSLVSRPDIERPIKLMTKKRFVSNERDKEVTLLRPTLSGSAFYGKNLKRRPPKDVYSLVTDVVKDTMSADGYSGSTNGELLAISSNEAVNSVSIKQNTELIFPHDQRFKHVLSLLESATPSRIQFYTAETEYSRILPKKKIFGKIIALRTLTSGVGRAAVNYSTEQPITSEKWHIEDLNYVTIFPDGSKLITPIEEFNKDVLHWGEFHNGVASALKISKNTRGINGSWIALNKPAVLNATHGGFLLGLGLNGHLKDLEEWHIYNYLSPKETLTSIGLLLGMSASAKGTQNHKLIKVLAVHVVALLPEGSSDLNINIRVQIAGLIGMGLLYLRCHSRKLTLSLLPELKSYIKVGDDMVADEGYRMSVGIAIGLNNLAAPNIQDFPNGDEDSFDDSGTFGSKSNEQKMLLSDHQGIQQNNAFDTELVQELLDIIIKTYDKEMPWIPENAQIGALLALTFMLLKSNNSAISSKIRVEIPKPSHNAYCRPEIFLHREWAYYMIEWDSIRVDIGFLLDGINADSLQDMNSTFLPIYYTIAGRALSMGVRYASTGNITARNSILLILDKFLPLYHYPGRSNSVDFQLTIKGITVIVNVLLVSLGMIMCATGDIEVLRRAKYLHETVTGKNSDLYKKRKTSDNTDNNVEESGTDYSISGVEPILEEVPDLEGQTNEADEADEFFDPSAKFDQDLDNENHYGKYIATNMTLGFLFLGSGQFALKTSDPESVAYLILSVLPVFMRPYPLQELKHFWCMAIEPRCLVVKDVITEKPINGVQVEVTLHSGELLKFKSPCLLPDIQTIAKLSLRMNRYFPLEFTFNNDFPVDEFFKMGLVIFIQPKDENYDEEPTEEDIGLSLIRKIDELGVRDDESDVVNFSKNLFDSLGIRDITMLELKKTLNDNIGSAKTFQDYDLEMLCSDRNVGDIVDYQNELWKFKHSTQ
ncbi:anaphase promoting complex subunit 1 KNAG_0F01340 [Huiozyma naganishii CBS 8797]|uniref:Uncharacterized protein n=1 Tax=Huiozyma naganishii (strain ATCC MYA-139 / BCRC 22969 / CBS 8797 / KCTC 17520 / NBRC 10181 / NCYC 3082 / Yp74L-3) TaxID=1071383 RepID=J7RZX3_HUIN7|nr:hypothetical protein KNAG_0F01340 [Kazachstania naganishii CBS 8797]CCK70802.1 hypothetical protein KNAG_0F01340 [Kazachstania naganishii CBS 8797]